MSRPWKSLKHAFAVDPPGPAEPTEEQREVVDRLCRTVAKNRLATPAMMGLEMARPLNYIGAMTMHTFAPAIWAIARKQSYEQYNELAAYLEKRGSIEWMINRIEELEAEMALDDAARKKRKKSTGRGRRPDDADGESADDDRAGRTG